jgi:hypothetical protein
LVEIFFGAPKKSREHSRGAGERDDALYRMRGETWSRG